MQDLLAKMEVLARGVKRTVEKKGVKISLKTKEKEEKNEEKSLKKVKVVKKSHTGKVRFHFTSIAKNIFENLEIKC